MRFFIFITAISLLSCGQSSTAKKEDSAKQDTAKTAIDTTTATSVVKTEEASYTTPDEATVNGLLNAKFGTQWHVLNDKEAKWMKDAFDYFIVPKRKESPNYPYITKGDFNADGKNDMAAVVTDSIKNSYKIAIILGPDNIKLWEEDIMIDAALSTTPKSVIEGMEGEKIKKVKLKADGINVEYFEKASFVLYWSGTDFKRIQTGD